MRDLIDLLATWLGPGLRRSARRAHTRACTWLRLPTPEPHGPVIRPAPAYHCRPLPPHVLARRRPLNGHDVDLVRPYYLHHLAGQNRRALQYHRRTAAALASYGIDYDAERVHQLTALPLPETHADRTQRELAHA